MIEINKTQQYNTIKDILSNPILFNCTYGQRNEELKLFDLEDKEFLLITDDKEVLGCFEIKEFTKVTIEAHIYILPKYWSKSTEIVECGHKWAIDHGYKVVFTSVPDNCIHILKFLQRINYAVCGKIENGIVYKGKLTTLFLFQKQLA